MTLRRGTCVWKEKQPVKETARMVEGPVENAIQMTSRHLWTVGRSTLISRAFAWENKVCNCGVILLSKR